jgi:hypothetical protein
MRTHPVVLGLVRLALVRQVVISVLTRYYKRSFAIRPEKAKLFRDVPLWQSGCARKAISPACGRFLHGLRRPWVKPLLTQAARWGLSPAAVLHCKSLSLLLPLNRHLYLTTTDGNRFDDIR